MIDLVCNTWLRRAKKNGRDFNSKPVKTVNANITMRLIVFFCFLFQLFLYSFVSYIDRKGCMAVYYFVLLDV